MVRQVGTHAEFQQLVASGDAIVVDFTASWCGPCRMIAPFFEQLATEFPWAIFVKVDVDSNQETAMANGVTAMPTFKVFRNSACVATQRGASPDALRNMVAANVGPKPEAKQHVDPVARQAAQRDALAKVLAGDKLRAKACLETLLKIFGNVVSSPNEPKYRTLKAENKTVKDKVLSCAGGSEMMLAAGFERRHVGELARPELLVLPDEADLAHLRDTCSAMEQVLPHLPPAEPTPIG